MVEIAKGLDLQQLGDLDAEIAALMKEWDLYGMAISIFQDKSLIYSKGFGMRDPHKGLEVNGDTLFRLASNTKAFTAMSLCMLVDDGKLDLDTPVKHYLPSFKLYDSFATERLTPRDLLTHRSGIPGHDWAFGGEPLKSRKERVELLHHLEPSFDLRTTIQYNNNMYMTAAYLLEHITGIQWETFVQERIFNALGMDNTNFSAVKSRNTGNYAIHCYKKDGVIGEYKIHGNDPDSFYPRGPAGAINSSLNDMNKWMLFNMNKGKFNNKQLISENTINQMFTPQMVDKNQMFFSEVIDLCSSLGWFTFNYRGHRMVAHGGFFGTNIHFFPDKGIGVVYMPVMSTGLHDVISYTIHDRLLGLPEIPWNERYRKHYAELEAAQRLASEENEQSKLRIPEMRPSHPLENYTGLYQHPAYGELLIKLEGNKLIYDKEKLELVHYHHDTFDIVSDEEGSLFKLTFHTDGEGKVSSASAPLEPAVKDIIFVKVIF